MKLLNLLNVLKIAQSWLGWFGSKLLNRGLGGLAQNCPICSKLLNLLRFGQITKIADIAQSDQN